MRNTTNRPLYKDPTPKVDCSRRNNSLEKQSLFTKNLKIEWRSLEEESEMDRSQKLRMMMDIQLFNGWLEKLNQQIERGTR